MSVSYRLPAAVLKGRFKNMSAGISVNNVFTIANKNLNGQDPETDNVGTAALPLTRQYVFSLNAGF
jgi:hypothetical protein